MFHFSRFSKLFLVVSCLFFSGAFHALAQNPIDSLKLVLKTNIHDTLKLEVMGQIMANTRITDPDHVDFIGKVKSLAEKNLKNKKISTREKLIWRSAIGQSYSNEASVLMSSDVMRSIELLDKSEKIFIEIKDYHQLAMTLVGKGVCYAKILNFTDAVKCYFRALKYFEKEKDAGGAAYATMQIANAYNKQGNDEKAILYYKKAMKHFESLKNPNVEDILTNIELNHNIGHVYLLMGDYVNAEKYLKKALGLAESIGDTQFASLILDKMGRIYFKQKKYKEALLMFEEALKQDQSDLFKSNVYTSLGEFYISQKKYKEAENYLQKALAIGLQYNSLNIEMHARKFLYQLYKEAKQFDKSLEMYETYAVLKDSAKIQESRDALKEQQLKYEFENKELLTKVAQQKKMAALKLENEQKNARKNIILYIVVSIAVLLLIIILFLNYYFKQKNLAEARKNEELKQRLLLTQMNPHFIFNSVDNIQSLIHQKQDKEAISYLTKFSKLTRQILENSRENYILLSEEISMLENYMTIQKLLYNNNFRYEILIDEEIDPESLLVPPMLTQPFIENAIKHGLKNKQEDGLVRIHYRIQNEKLSFEVTDNGAGLTQEEEKQHKSLSTQITRERLESIASGKNISIETTNIMDTDNIIQGVKTYFEIPYVFNH